MRASVVFVLVAGFVTGQSAIKLHDGGIWSNYTTVPSVIWTNPAANQEAADDFNVVGTITRVLANGNGCWQCVPPALAGVWVRFYAWQSGVPGSLQYQVFVPAGSSQLLYNPSSVDVLDVTLPTPFSATGQHFVSVQASFVVAGYWSLWICDENAPTGAPVKFRNNLTSSPWGAYSQPGITALSADLDLELWGFPAAPQPQPVDPCGAWEVRSPSAVSGSTHTLIRDLKVIAPDDVWAVGDATVGPIGAVSTLNVSWHWDGVQWTEIPVPNPAPGTTLPNCTLYAVDAVGPNDVYAAGFQTITVPGGWYGQQVEVVHWDGSQWSLFANTPLPPTSIGAGVTGARVFDVDARTSNDIWFAGFWIDLLQSGATTQPGLLMRYDGTNFTQTNVPLVVSGSQGQTFTAIEAIAANDVWAIGYRHGLSAPLVPVGTPLLFHWDGSNWTSVPPPVPGTPSIFSDIAALGPNDIWILGYHLASPATAVPFMIHWDGSAWTFAPAPPGGGSLKAFAPNDIYAASSSVWHFDGNGWTEVQSFPSLSDGRFAAIDGVAPCQLWGGGGQTLVGQNAPFVARQAASIYANTSQRTGCLPGSTPGSLVAVTQPRLGTFFTVGLSDPGLALTLPTGVGFSWWVVTAAPISISGCGAPIPGIGLGGGVGEALVDITTTLLATGPFVWGGGASVVTHDAFIPNIPAFAGIQAYSQGVLIDASSASHLILTPALDFRVGY